MGRPVALSSLPLRLPISDAAALLRGSVDPTKQLRIEVDGITTGTTRVITVPDANIDLTPTTGSFQGADVELTAIAGLTSAAGKGIHFTGAGAAAVHDLTAAARTVLDDATVGDMVNTLGGSPSTGTGGLVRGTSPTLVTPSLGAATATTLNLSTLAGSDPAMQLIDADVSHPFTGIGGSYADVIASTSFKLFGGSTGGLIATGFRSNSGAALAFDTNIGTATPTSAPILFSAWKTDGAASRVAVSDSEAVMAFRAGSTICLQGTGGGSLTLGGTTLPTGATRNLIFAGGSTSPVLGATTADACSMTGMDTAAANRNVYTRNEEGKMERHTGLRCRVEADFSRTSSTVLTNITGLSRPVAAGEVYAFRAILFTTSHVAGGVKFAIGGTATATSLIAEARVFDASTLATVGTSRVTAMATTLGDVTVVAVAQCTIEGLIVVNAAGTITIQLAQNASNGTASTVLAGSYFELIPIGS